MKKYLRLFRRIQFGPLPFSLGLALLLGMILSLSMRMDPPPGSVVITERAPASVQSPWEWMTSSNVSGSLSGPEELQLDCSVNSHRPPFVSKSPFIRFELQGCKVGSITNSRNDFEATIFDLNENTSSSDFISLVKGENEIQVNAENLKGPMSFSLKVIYQ